MKKTPLRRSVVTKEQLPKQELLRVVKNKENKIFVDETGKAGGRGAYIKKDINVLETAKEKKILNKIFDCEINEELYDEIKNIINK